MHKVIVVEAVIGAGKSSFCEDLATSLGPDTLMLTEPDERDNGNPYLGLYYDDPDRWAFTLQMHMLMARFSQQKLAQEHVMSKRGHAVLDRSYYGDTAFARLQLQRGHMNHTEYRSYADAYRTMTCHVLLPAVCVHLVVSPETALERIKRRSEARPSREFEVAVDLEYLKGLDREIQHMVQVLRRQNVHVLEMPWDEDRSSQADRIVAADVVAGRINALNPPDFFDLTDEVLVAHRRLAMRDE